MTIFSQSLSLTRSLFKTVILKTDISDSLPFFYISQDSLPQGNEDRNTFIYKSTYNTECMEHFKQKLYEIEWNEHETL